MAKEKKSYKGTILGIFIAFIMVSSVIGFLYGGQTDQYTYKNLKFTRTSNAWTAVVNGQKLTFDYFPSDVEQIQLGDDVKQELLNRPEIDTTSDTDDLYAEDIALAQYNMDIVLQKLNVFTRRGFTTNNEYGLPIITCKDSTQAVPVIYFQQSNETSISLEDSCILAKARTSVDVLRLKDRILYSMLGIIS